MVDTGKAWAELQPQLAEAARTERKQRSESWLNLPVDICGITVKPLTLERFCLLKAAESPFIVGGTVTAGAIAQFLWIVSDGFCINESEKVRFLKSVRDINAAAALIAIYQYIDDAFFDAPKSDADDAREPPSLALEAVLIDRLGSLYHWTPETILKMPMAQIFQLLTANGSGGTTTPLQDEIKREFLMRMNEDKN